MSRSVKHKFKFHEEICNYSIFNNQPAEGKYEKARYFHWNQVYDLGFDSKFDACFRICLCPKLNTICIHDSVSSKLSTFTGHRQPHRRYGLGDNRESIPASNK